MEVLKEENVGYMVMMTLVSREKRGSVTQSQGVMET